MKRLLRLAIVVFAAAAVALAAQSPAEPTETSRVVLDTELGQIEIEVDPMDAPHDAALFLGYVDLGLLDGATFLRVVRLPPGPQRTAPLTFVSAEIDPSRREQAARTRVPERPTARRVDARPGSVALMPSMRDPKVSDVVICLNADPRDRSFPPLGSVVRGLDIVRRVATRPAHGQQLDQGVRILSARRVHEE